MFCRAVALAGVTSPAARIGVRSQPVWAPGPMRPSATPHKSTPARRTAREVRKNMGLYVLRPMFVSVAHRSARFLYRGAAEAHPPNLYSRKMQSSCYLLRPISSYAQYTFLLLPQHVLVAAVKVGRDQVVLLKEENVAVVAGF